jgi:hypothetical protein
MIRFTNHYLALALATSVVGLWGLTACQDDDEWTPDVGVEEGRPATIQIGLHVSDMDIRTRSIIDEANSSYCDNVWVGVYLVSSGECVSNRVYVTDATSETDDGTLYSLPNLTVIAESGYAHIVAVANVDNEEATMNASDDAKDRISLRDALEQADTWEKFKKICVHKTEAGATAVRTGTLMMSGYYIGSDTLSTGCADGIPCVEVQPGSNNLKGAIYLRRLTSYNKVKISAGPNITMSLKTWHVGNIPTDSYLFENTGNAGTLTPASSQPYANSTPTHVFSLAEESTSDKQIYEFEFYQYENKHTACDYATLAGSDQTTTDASATDQTTTDASATTQTTTDYVGVSTTGLYADREREYKEADGSNSGIYKSLVSDRNNAASLDNNNASYFVFTAQLEYYIADTETNRKNPGKAQPVAYDATQKQIHRTAQATYLVHLGYCEDKDTKTDQPTVATARDFNCRRNTKYTYNIQVLGANKIVVEAKKEGEEQPGAEGSVYDDYGDYIAMDSHYCEFNIGLTNAERARLKYRIYAPYNGYTHTFLSSQYQTAWEDNQLYNWVKIKPATARDVLAAIRRTPTTTTTSSRCKTCSTSATTRGARGASTTTAK